jgi:hypothetical protein
LFLKEYFKIDKKKLTGHGTKNYSKMFNLNCGYTERLKFVVNLNSKTQITRKLQATQQTTTKKLSRNETFSADFLHIF